MFRVRYVAAVLVGLAVGAAAGWISGRGFDASHQAATTRSHAGHHSAHKLTPPARPNGNAPHRTTPPRPLTPGLQQVQQRIVRCLYDSATWRQQVACLQGVLRLEIAGTRSLGLSFAGQPFRLDVQRPGRSDHT
jgi:hypothetical protein